MSRSRSAHETPQPVAANRSGPKIAPHVGEGRCRKLGVRVLEHAVDLSARVGDEQVRAAVAVEVAARDAHARARVGDAGLGGELLEAEPEPGRIGLRAARPGDVVVQAVGLGVVGDVEVEVAVEVEVGEHGAEAVLELDDLESGLGADLAEGLPSSLVQVQQVADAEYVLRETRPGRRGRGSRVGVAGDEQVGQAVAVHVADGGAGVPAEGRDAGVAAPSVNVPSPSFHRSAARWRS